MSDSLKRWTVGVFAAALCLSLTVPAFAEEGKSLTGFLKGVFNWSGKTVKKEGEAVAHVAENTGGTLSKAGEDISKAEVPQMVGDTVGGVAATTGQAAAETVSAPVQAADEAGQEGAGKSTT